MMPAVAAGVSVGGVGGASVDDVWVSADLTRVAAGLVVDGFVCLRRVAIVDGGVVGSALEAICSSIGNQLNVVVKCAVNRVLDLSPASPLMSLLTL